jgi:small-conductance mechanosensitive channel
VKFIRLLSRLLLPALCLTVLLAAPLPCRAQPATNSAGSQVALSAQRSQLQTRLAEAKADLGRAQARLVATNLPPGATPTEAVEYRWVLQSLVRSYQQHLDDLTGLESLEQRREDLESTIKSWAGFPDPPPYSVLMVDDLRDAAQSLQAKLKAVSTARDIINRFNEDAEATLKESDGKLRKFSEQLETAQNAAQVARLTWQQTVEQARNRLAAAGVAARVTGGRQIDAELAEHRLRLAFVQRQLALAVPHTRFSKADLDQVFENLDAEQRALEAEYQSVEAEHELRQQVLTEAREALRLALQPSAEAATNAGAQAELIRQRQAQVQLRGTQAETTAQHLSVLRQLGKFLTTERGLWQMRFTAFGTHDLDTLRGASRRLEHLSDLVVTWKPYFTQQIEAAARQIAEQQNRLQNPTLAPEEAGQTRELLLTYQQREEFYHRALRSLQKAERLVTRWQETLELDRRALPLSGRLRDLFSGVSTFAVKLWNFELLVVDDTITVDGQQISGRRGVTVGKISLAILILVVGYWLTGWISRRAEPIAVRRLKIEPNQASLIRRWVRVVLVLGLVVFSLVSVKIPLTVFAFAGGALAIGVGFGTQNLLKNFISGIIILFERPFRVGDVLDVAGQRGTVTGIGIRSSVLHLFDDTETLIPNSALLENNLTNWTYSSRTVRFTVTVGVAYGSDTRRVAQVLAEIADRHGKVQKDPKPQVVFSDFADSALTFELRYWVDVVRHNASQVASDLRHMIAGSFAEHGLSIAFPQRDVHLDTTRPLQIQMTPPPPTEQPAAAAPVANVLPA